MSKTGGALSGAASGAATGTSIMPGWGTAIGAVAGGLIGMAGSKDDNSGQMLEQLMQKAQAIPLPILKEYYPELYRVVAEMNPELETAVNLGPSQMEGVSTDPALRQAQMNALMKLQEIGVDGQTAQDELASMKIMNTMNTANKGNQDAILQNMAMRGTGGGGTELAARMAASQGASNQAAQMAMEEKAQAERRALEALMQSGSLAGNMQAQDFSQASAKAQAQDAISRFNASNQQQVMNNNVAAKNQGQLVNMQNQQNVANQNTGTRNNQQMYNLGLNQQNYDNELKKYGIVSNATAASAQNAQAQAQAQNQQLGTAFNAAGMFAANYKPQEEKPQQIGGYTGTWDYDPNKRKA